MQEIGPYKKNYFDISQEVLGLKERSKEFEDFILFQVASKECASFFYSLISFYTNKFLDQKWPDLERLLIATQNIELILFYNKKVLDNQRWEEAEKAILKSHDIDGILDYALNTLDEPWQEAEELFLKPLVYVKKSGVHWNPLNCSVIPIYAEHVLQGRWLEGEQKLLGYLKKDATCIDALFDYLFRVVRNCSGNYRWEEGKREFLRHTSLGKRKWFYEEERLIVERFVK